MKKYLKDLWINDVNPHFAEEGLFLGLLNLFMFFVFLVVFSPFFLLWGLNDLSKTWFKSDSK